MSSICIRVLQVPAADSAGWKCQFRRACEEMGWDFHEYWGGEAPVLDTARNSVIFCWDDTGESLVATHWVVLSCSPDEAVAVLRRDLNLSREDAIYHASGRFALASTLIQNGGTLCRTTDAEILVPGLGPVEAPMDHGEERQWDHVPELAIYDSLPPIRGSRVHWPSGAFTYPDVRILDGVRGKFALLGRRRLLLNGPNISLPRGIWTAKATFAVRPREKADLLIEWGYGNDVESFDKVFDIDGRYTLQLTHAWRAAAPADFRISLMMPVLEGDFEFDGVEVTLSETVGDPQIS